MHPLQLRRGLQRLTRRRPSKTAHDGEGAGHEDVADADVHLLQDGSRAEGLRKTLPPPRRPEELEESNAARTRGAEWSAGGSGGGTQTLPPPRGRRKIAHHTSVQANGEGKRGPNLTKFWQIRACSTGACLEPFPYCSLGIRLDRPEQAHHDGRAGPPDPHGEEKPSMKIGESPCPAEMHALKPTNLSQSQLSNNRPPKPPDYPYKRRLTWSLPLFSAASRTRPWPLQDWARAPLYLSMCCVFNSDS